MESFASVATGSHITAWREASLSIRVTHTTHGQSHGENLDLEGLFRGPTGPRTHDTFRGSPERFNF